MSDVNNAPPPAPAPTPAPANEVPINPNPVSSPTPVGPQAPEAPVGDVEGGKGRPASRRETIRKAFEKANAEPVKAPAAARPKAAAKAQPPAQDPEEADFSLKRPPQHREAGRFARAPQADTEPQQQLPLGEKQQPGKEGQPGVQPAFKPAAPLPETAPFREAPPRFSERGKAEWAAAPESVRGEIHRMAKEFDGAYRQYRGDHETMNTIRPFHELATKHGTTLDKALNNYVGMEHKLREDVVGGLDQIVNNLNLWTKTEDGRQVKLGLRDVAYHILNQSPEQSRLVQNQNATQAAKHQIGELHQLVGSLAQSVQQLHYDRQFGETRGAVDKFADTHPGFDELGDLIEQELAFGFDLETAYQRAARLRPPSQPHAAQTRTTPAQTRQDKSIYGAPESGPSNGREPRRQSDKPVGRREAISNAIKRVNGRV